MIDLPGARNTLLVWALPGILPCLSTEERMDVTHIYAMVDQLSPGVPLVCNPPSHSPNPTISHIEPVVEIFPFLVGSR
jgi:predicted ATPase with chaperone activity